MYYNEILEKLHSQKVRYLIVGGLAVNLHGVPRATQDIDLIISTDKKNILTLVKALTDLGYVPRIPVDPNDLADSDKVNDWVNNKNMKAFSFYHKSENFKVVDIVLVHPLDFNEAYSRRLAVSYRSIEVPTASIDDIITMKKASGRPQDTSDIEMLMIAKKISGETDD